MDKFHVPVLRDEAISGLKIKDKGLYIDATIGGGGHTEEILKRGGKVVGIDQDKDAIVHLKKKFESEISQGLLVLVRGNFADIKEIAEKRGITEADGILFDLGVSSYQIDNSGRGFSFIRDEPLDMGMDSSALLQAKEIIITWPDNQLIEILKYLND